MRASELLGVRVVDADGVALGPIRDVRVAWEDEPAPPPAVSSRFEIVGLVIGGGRLAAQAHAWGFAERRAAGPWLLRKLFASAIEDARFIPAGAVKTWGADSVELECPASELGSLASELTD